MAILTCQLVLLFRTNQTLSLPVDPLQVQAVLLHLGETTLERIPAKSSLSFSKNMSTECEMERIIPPDGERRVGKQID